MKRFLALVLCSVVGAAPLAASAQSEAERLAELLGAKPGTHIAEIGAGQGQMAVEMAKRVGPSGHVFATELDPKRRSQIAASARAAGVGNVEVVEAQLAATGLPDRCCDAVFLRDVYHHLTAPAAIAADLQRALVPGGTLVVVDFPPTWYLRPWAPSGVNAARAGHGIAADDALRELEAAGFTRVHVLPHWTSRWLAGDVYALVLRAP